MAIRTTPLVGVQSVAASLPKFRRSISKDGVKLMIIDGDFLQQIIE
jgi:hypothetical protein